MITTKVANARDKGMRTLSRLNKTTNRVIEILLKDRRQYCSGNCYEAPRLDTVLLLMRFVRCSLSLIKSSAYRCLLRIGTVPIIANGRYNRDLACTPVVLINYEFMQVLKIVCLHGIWKRQSWEAEQRRQLHCTLKKMYDCWSAFLKIDNNCGRRFFRFVLSCLPNDQSFCAHSTSKLPITNLVLVSS